MFILQRFLIICILTCASYSSTITGAEIEATGYVRVQQIDGVWWFISADGEPFVSTGVNHATSATYWLQSYNRDNTVKLFGDDILLQQSEKAIAPKKALLKKVEGWMHDWHFNTFGMHTSDEVKPYIDSDIYYMTEIKLMTYHTSMKPGDPWPDVFSDAFVQQVDEKAKEVCTANRDKRNLIGYYFTDEAAWMSYFRRLPDDYKWWFYFNPWVDYMRKLPAGEPGKQAWMSVLKANHASPREAARVYGVQANSWIDVEQLTEWPAPEKTPKTYKDNIAMLTRIAEKWYAIQHTAIKKYDPNHLIIGDKQYRTVPDWLAPILKRYVDVISIQRFGSWDYINMAMEDVYRKTGKPILSGDGNCGYVSAYTESMRGEYKVSEYNEEAMGYQYGQLMEGLSSSPFMVGLHHCGFIEGWGTPARRNYAIRYGFVNPFGEPYKVFTEHVSRANRQVDIWHKAVTR